MIDVDLMVLTPNCGVDLDATTDADNCPPCAQRKSADGTRCSTHADFIAITDDRHLPSCSKRNVPLCEGHVASMRREGGLCWRCQQVVDIVAVVVL